MRLREFICSERAGVWLLPFLLLYLFRRFDFGVCAVGPSVLRHPAPLRPRTGLLRHYLETERLGEDRYELKETSERRLTR